MNYLGVTVQNKKDCFKLHKEECLNKARHRSNLMPAVIAKSCNKILIGKTYWKNAALPSRPAPMSVYNGILRSYFLLGTKISFASNNDEKIVDHIYMFLCYP